MGYIYGKGWGQYKVDTAIFVFMLSEQITKSNTKAKKRKTSRLIIHANY